MSRFHSLSDGMIWQPASTGAFVLTGPGPGPVTASFEALGRQLLRSFDSRTRWRLSAQAMTKNDPAVADDGTRPLALPFEVRRARSAFTARDPRRRSDFDAVASGDRT